ncbi:ABC-three component system middle component 8 [Cryobacterium sp. Y57]|uniref:ABC-three component system middle component 8 n=1 Tax=Cryobacterium sp. Y57 TaxID=2048287 RepID=UPI00351A020E
MIKHVSRYRVVTYDNLLEHCRKRDISVDYLFAQALSLLYVLGLVEYLPKADSFEWVGSPAT